MRKQIVAGNWKMNLNAAESQELIAALKAQSFDTNVHVAIATPTYTYQQQQTKRLVHP